ncbi:MAG: hypothetical protein K6E76_02345 [Patescibacteria group bacterium]|nr:hypothetical protein [Patescibacteria group bacterium]
MRIIGFGKVDQVAETEENVKTEPESEPVAGDAPEAKVETVKTGSDNN